ncbi:hypothetical protein [Phycisphaera mikurensis]|uniref:Rod shape-determining protein MreD n=1 Tax=Phycisphaera mikurensis (strain NBRC 102666 / KCTC 22515 / FYK2301M01) TaxID=1142394 RepID=I0IGW9_PHYMF|nr:hypothetical protein [Phycisphaera mikurensis]MBB6440764.1 cell shape-determining protein MreD [Phycisphaera mikurensis]BAM04507.1 hypothetical protein PSMK_23480 [Phycisphaera mikurensis NBRC 102666]
MSLVPAAILTLAAVLLQEGLEPWWRLGGVAPEPLLVLVMYAALVGPAVPAVRLAVVGGLLADLLGSPFEGPAIAGPRTLGYVVGAYAVVLARGSLFRGSVVTLVLMVLLGGFFAELVATSLVTLRGLGPLPGGPPLGWVPSRELRHRVGRLLLSAAAAVPLGLVLFALRRWSGLERGRE